MLFEFKVLLYIIRHLFFRKSYTDSHYSQGECLSLEIEGYQHLFLDAQGRPLWQLRQLWRLQIIRRRGLRQCAGHFCQTLAFYPSIRLARKDSLIS